MSSDREQLVSATHCAEQVLRQMHVQAELAAHMHHSIGSLLQSYEP